MNSKKNMILRSALCGAAIGAFILFFFGDGWLMAFYLLFEGAIIGAVTGGFVGLIIKLAMKSQQRA